MEMRSTEMKGRKHRSMSLFEMSHQKPWVCEMLTLARASIARAINNRTVLFTNRMILIYTNSTLQ